MPSNRQFHVSNCEQRRDGVFFIMLGAPGKKEI